MITQLNTEEFLKKVHNFKTDKEWNFQGTKPCIIDFYADWCGPCKAIAPILKELSNEYEDIDIYKLDVDAESEVAQAFGIRSIPSILFCPVNDEPQMAQGALPKEAIVEAINKLLLKSNSDGDENNES